MKLGKIASVSLVVFTALAATTLHSALGAYGDQIAGVSDFGPIGRTVVFAMALLCATGAVLLPLGILLDRSIAGIQRFVEKAAEQDKPPLYVGPSWLRPLSGSMLSALDISRQREQSLRNQLRDLEIRHRVTESERRQIEAVLHSLRDSVLVTDAFNEIVMANQAAADTLGFKLEDAIHTPVTTLLQDKWLCRTINDVRENFQIHESRHIEHELEVRTSSGEIGTVTFDIGLSCVANHKQEVAGVVAILHDLTRERELSQLKTDFVSKASHELRTPLSSIRAYVEMLVDGEASDEDARKDFYHIIQSETDRLGRLIDNMLNISRIEAGIVQIDRENVDIKSQITRAISTIEPQARERDIAINARLADIPLVVEGDDDMLYQVVLNLMSNAVKYTPEGGRITVAADSDNLTRSVVVSISDTGLGIPPDALPRLFEKFYRVENYKRVAKGTGLGLSLCKNIIETMHHGQIGVESKLGLGSKFWYSIPMRYAGSSLAA